MLTCPFETERLLEAPSGAVGALQPDFYPGQYGAHFRRAVVDRFGTTDEATLDAIELQRYAQPLVTEIYTTVGTTDPENFITEELKESTGLDDVRVAVQSEMLRIADTAHSRLYATTPEGRAAQVYYDTVSQRYLTAKQRPGTQAFDRVKDGIGTASRAPFKFLSALEHFAAEQQLAPDTLARNSWQFVHSMASLDLESYNFLDAQLFEPRDIGDQGAVKSWRFAATKWADLITFDTNPLRLQLTIAPPKIGAIALSKSEIQQLQSAATTGAERLRCPITRLPKSLTRTYVNFLVDITQGSGVWAADKSSGVA